MINCQIYFSVCSVLYNYGTTSNVLSVFIVSILTILLEGSTKAVMHVEWRKCSNDCIILPKVTLKTGRIRLSAAPNRHGWYNTMTLPRIAT